MFHRRSIRLREYDYSQPGAYYVTITTLRMRELFGEISAGVVRLSPLGRIVEREWLRLPNRFIGLELDEYVIMPNHIHGILVLIGNEDIQVVGRPKVERFGNPVAGSLPTIVRSYKASVTGHWHRVLGRNANPVWQRNYYEHVIRNQQDLERIREYILMNPQRWDEDKSV